MSRERRQRSKQRRHRAQDGGGTGDLVRADLPGALQHASGEVDEFDAALIRGAEGVPAQADQEPQPSAARDVAQEQGGAGNGGGRNGNGSVGDVAGEEAFGAEPEVRRPSGVAHPRRSLGARAVAFLKASWAELQRVQWPDRREVSQATAVVLGFVAVAGIYLGVADYVAQKIVNFIL